MQIKDLSPNPNNPRVVSDAKLEMLKKSLEKFGDLSGFVFNRRSGQLVGGHMRAKVLPHDAKIEIDFEYDVPSEVGSVATGYVQIGDEIFSYREVDWDSDTEKAANIAANKGAGDWDATKLSDWFSELGTNGFDLDFTMFDDLERNKLMNPKTREVSFEAKELSEDEFSSFEHQCPKCGFEFDSRK